MVAPIQQYYETVQDVRNRLEAEGRRQDADALRGAIRASSTSGEAIASVGLILRRLLSEPASPEVTDAVNVALDLGIQIWNASNG